MAFRITGLRKFLGNHGTVNVEQANPAVPLQSRQSGQTVTLVRRTSEELRRISGYGNPPVTKKRGNPDWGKPDLNAVGNNGPTSFEEIVRELRLSPAEYQHSTELKAWVQKNKDQKYVPSDLLRAWDFEVKGDL